MSLPFANYEDNREWARNIIIELEEAIKDRDLLRLWLYINIKDFDCDNKKSLLLHSNDYCRTCLYITKRGLIIFYSGCDDDNNKYFLYSKEVYCIPKHINKILQVEAEKKRQELSDILAIKKG